MAEPALVEPLTAAAPKDTSEALGDIRFRRLLGADAWAALDPAIQRRFSKRLAGGGMAVYAGEVAEVKASLAGRCLARLATLIGGPLPLVWIAPTPSVVTVTEADDGAQIWTRLYARPGGFPQIVHSSKRFIGATGLEEYVGHGVGMALTVAVEDAALIFRSAFYFLALGTRRLRLPRVVSPGRLTVTHRELGGGRFAFTLELRHPLFGPLLRQHAVFKENA
jgi:hypothetical protein